MALKTSLTKEFIPDIDYKLLEYLNEKFFQFTKQGHDLLDPISKDATKDLINFIRNEYKEAFKKIDDIKKKEKVNKNSFLFKSFLKKNYTEDQIKYFATCSLIADLIEAGFYIRTTRDGFSVRKPYDNINKKLDPKKIKEQVRDFHLSRRDEQIRSFEIQKFLNRMETPKKVGNEFKSILDVIDNGKELADLFENTKNLTEEERLNCLKNIIKPELVPCFPDDYFKEEKNLCPYTRIRLIDIWRYIRLTWSIELKSVPGRSFPFLIRNAARPNKPIIGITLFRSPAISDKARDSYIGWHTEEQIRDKIYRGDLSIDDLVKSLIKQLKKAISEVYISDFVSLSKKDLRYPTPELLEYLKGIDEKKSNDRLDELEVENYKSVNKIDHTKANDYETLAVSSLYTAKRARRLCDLLEIQLAFNEHGLYKDAAKGYASLSYSQKGRELIERLIREIRIKALSENIVDIGVCGAVSPYNELLGGKLVTLLMASQECHDAYSERYKNQISQIASQVAGKEIVRKADLFAFTTTSLYGVGASQYNRLQLLQKDHPELKNDIGLFEVFNQENDEKISMVSKGVGTHHISNETTRLLEACKVAVIGHDKVTFTFGEGTSPKLRSLSAGLKLLIHPSSDIRNRDFLTHSFQRKNFIMITHKNPLKKLLLQEKEEDLNLSNVSDIGHAWLRRWVLNRSTRPETIAKLRSFSPENIKDCFPRVEFESEKNIDLFTNA